MNGAVFCGRWQQSAERPRPRREHSRGSRLVNLFVTTLPIPTWPSVVPDVVSEADPWMDG